ncbi:hypothetical protein RM550_26235 [Streptomyces sp. DSM 41527]|uniref:Integral membrane protein n=1 Tax=Streptomyces mooreae TaxID=3075523 RepID=A0ABU2TE32_9ACTN|nr:hypothetical protein [Streptomyces sp. DSM 41527]MDT0459174.1 hypothetical protein [Streptomyces sp. DSM 41527]
MHHFLASAADPDLHHHVSTLAGGVDVISGVRPDWGPFKKLGTTSTVLLGVMAAFALVAGAAAFFMGLAKSKGRIGESHSTMSSVEGKGLMVGGGVVFFLVASFGTLATIVYGMGV